LNQAQSQNLKRISELEEELVHFQNLEKENTQVTNSLIKELEDKIEFLINKNEMAIQDMNRTTESRVEEFERVNKELEEKIKQLVTDKEILVWF
jgi:Mg2+ and Co2+ transporter CorA